MKNLARRLVVSALSLLAFVSAQAGVEGTYQVDVEALKAAALQSPDIQAVPEAQRPMILAMFDSMKVTIVIKDGEFTADSDVMGEVHSGKGKYTVDGDQLTMTTTEQDGEAVEEPEEQSAKIEGDTLVIFSEGMPFPIILKKAE